MKDRHLISFDELRAAGALDVPAAWRKSLGGGAEGTKVERNLFSELSDEVEGGEPGSQQQPALIKIAGDGIVDQRP